MDPDASGVVLTVCHTMRRMGLHVLGRQLIRGTDASTKWSLSARSEIRAAVGDRENR